VTKEEYKRFLTYCGAFYNNMGNYKSYGHKKFIPEISKSKFEKILKSNPLY
jgi:dipeptidyl-peptidase-3